MLVADLLGLARRCAHGSHFRRLCGQAHLLPRPAENDLKVADRGPFVHGWPTDLWRASALQNAFSGASAHDDSAARAAEDNCICVSEDNCVI